MYGCIHVQCSRIVVGPSYISGNKQLGPENSSPTSNRLSDVKFGTNLDVLAEITVRENHYWESDQSQDSLQNDQSTGYRSISICKVFLHYIYLDRVGYQQWCLRKYLFFRPTAAFWLKKTVIFKSSFLKGIPTLLLKYFFLMSAELLSIYRNSL